MPGLIVLAGIGAGVLSFARLGPYGHSSPADPRVHREYDPKTGALTMLVYDVHGRHKPDTWSYFKDGRVVLTRVDEDGDGVIDTWFHYRPDGSVEKTGFSTKNDGVEDAWRYETPAGEVMKIEYSASRDGVVTRTDFLEGHVVVRTEPSAASLKRQESP